MGWSFGEGQTKQELVDELTGPNTGIDTVRKALKGNHLWVIHRVKHGEQAGLLVIAVYLLAYQRGYGWGYKGVAESDGPAVADCPVRFLDEVPEPDSEYARNWRLKVRELDRLTKERNAAWKKVMPGQRFHTRGLKHPLTVTLVSKKPLICSDGAKNYKFQRKYLGDPITGS